MKIFLGLLLASIPLFAKGQQQSDSYLPRHRYFQNGEPENEILIGAGQANLASFLEFAGATDSLYLPEIYMDYVNLKQISKDKISARVAGWKKVNWEIIPQIGLSMTFDGEPERRFEHEVDAGALDSNIVILGRTLAQFQGKMMIRLGYEFNGHWNGYIAKDFIPAYRRVAQMLRTHLGDKLILVWCMALDGSQHNFMDFFPGDDVVDWWSVDVFGETHFRHPALKPFLDSAHAHKRPVLIGECTPRKIPVQLGQESVDRWFKPFFNMIAQNPGIKGFSYIYWNWAKTPWSDWGDGRFGKNEVVKSYVNNELKNPIFRKARK